MTNNQPYHTAIRDAIQHVQRGPILPAEPLRITPKYTCPRCQTHAGSIIVNDMNWPTTRHMRCGWCHYSYPIPD